MKFTSQLSIMIVAIFMIIGTSLLTGCSEGAKAENPEIKQEAMTQGSTQGQEQAEAGDQQGTEQANPFDPRNLKVGDKVAGMEVTKADILPTTDAAFYVDQANIDFTGEIEVKGTIEFYPQGFEHLDQQVTFKVDESSAFPRMKVSDDPNNKLYDKINLKFENPEDIKKFGEKPVKGQATLVISQYHIRFPGVEEQDSAVVKKVVTMKVEELKQ